MKRTPTRRRAEHLAKGDGAFIPPERMRAIRFEEAVARRQAKAAGDTDPVVHHSTCHCGSIDCVGVPVVTSKPPRRKRSR